MSWADERRDESAARGRAIVVSRSQPDPPLFVVLLALVVGFLVVAYGISLAWCGSVRRHAREQAAWPRFHIRYYTFALLFIAFDMEIAYVHPWTVVLRELDCGRGRSHSSKALGAVRSCPGLQALADRLQEEGANRARALDCTAYEKPRQMPFEAVSWQLSKELRQPAMSNAEGHSPGTDVD